MDSEKIAKYLLISIIGFFIFGFTNYLTDYKITSWISKTVGSNNIEIAGNILIYVIVLLILRAWAINEYGRERYRKEPFLKRLGIIIVVPVKLLLGLGMVYGLVIIGVTILVVVIKFWPSSNYFDYFWR